MGAPKAAATPADAPALSISNLKLCICSNERNIKTPLQATDAPAAIMSRFSTSFRKNLNLELSLLEIMSQPKNLDFSCQYRAPLR